MKKIIVLLALLLVSAQTFAEVSRIYQGRYSGAIRGYDPVAYFTESEAVRGTRKITYDYLGATWWFSSEENKKLFVENPEKYMPQYGGYCAKAMSDNRFLKIDPKSWSIVNDKLYLNYSSKTRIIWQEQQVQMISTADQNWKVHLKDIFNEDVAQDIDAESTEVNAALNQ